jgi:lipoyl(octanoyl) transferase
MLIVRPLEHRDYLSCWRAMQGFTEARSANTADEIWLIEHPPVYTLGQAGKMEHVLNPGNIPLVPVDRGGQVTYHGPGQLMVYTLIDIRRRGMGVRELVSQLEQIIVALLADYGIAAIAKRDAPGVYVDEAKICSLGLRIKRGCSYHGLALNVNMDLAPFKGINPCGYANLAITDIATQGGPKTLEDTISTLLKHLVPVFE